MAENKNSKRWLTIAFVFVAVVVIIWPVISRDRSRKGMESWVGKPAADFALKDLDGKEHKLSDYRGKNVMIVFWATWCPPCRMEIPHLIELRNTMSKDDLAILAISNEEPDLVKSFASTMKLNYTILSAYNKPLPEPYDMVTSIPMAFFVNPAGQITKINVGLMGMDEMKAALAVK